MTALKKGDHVWANTGAGNHRRSRGVLTSDPRQGAGSTQTCAKVRIADGRRMFLDVSGMILVSAVDRLGDLVR